MVISHQFSLCSCFTFSCLVAFIAVIFCVRVPKFVCLGYFIYVQVFPLWGCFTFTRLVAFIEAILCLGPSFCIGITKVFIFHYSTKFCSSFFVVFKSCLVNHPCLYCSQLNSNLQWPLVMCLISLIFFSLL